MCLGNSTVMKIPKTVTLGVCDILDKGEKGQGTGFQK